MNELQNIQTGRKKIRLIFMVTIFGLILQYMLVGIIGYYQSEPWPAFVLPGFKAVYHDGSNVQLTVYEFYVSWQQEPFVEMKIENDQIFKEIPTSMRRGVIAKKFREWSVLTEGDGELEQWFRVRLSQLYPDRIPIELKVIKKQQNYYRNGDGLQLADQMILENHTFRL